LTAKVLDLECSGSSCPVCFATGMNAATYLCLLSVIYLLNVMILSFQDRDTHTSEIKFIKQGGALDLAKLSDISTLHWEVRFFPAISDMLLES
jgi:hypothetical protein